MAGARRLAVVATLAVALTLVPGRGLAQTCNTSDPPCTGAPACRGGGSAPIAIFHARMSPCGTSSPGGSFDFRDTEYATTCLLGRGCPVAVPPLRYWQYEAYASANSGCYDPVAGQGVMHAALDFGIGASAGYWSLYAGNWLSGPTGDGAISVLNGELRTVVEFSFPDGRAEGTIDHRSWYLVASVPMTSDYDFDRLRGGTGCSPATVAIVPVPSLTISGGPGPCAGGAVASTGADNAVDPAGHFDIEVSLTDPDPSYYDEVGRNTPARPLIAGYQILYSGGRSPDPGSEPRSSDRSTGAWLPARYPADPSQVAPVVPLGVARATVSVPTVLCSGAPCWNWLATRLVYQDSSLNPTGPTPPGSGPLVVSDVSSHCGPVAAAATPGRIVDLRLRRAGSIATDLFWTADLRARGGYELRRLADKTELPDTLGRPPDLGIPTATPSFPVRDSVGAPVPALLLYQVVGLDGTGRPGPL